MACTFLFLKANICLKEKIPWTLLSGFKKPIPVALNNPPICLYYAIMFHH